MPAFQSALPRGERLGMPQPDAGPRRVSIRAPARERPSSPASRVAVRMFQSALPRGERRHGRPQKLFIACFDPRSRTGSDLADRLPRHCEEGFDPRSRTGSDVADPRCSAIASDVSIRAPARGATCRFARLCASKRFRSALPHGERPANLNPLNPGQCFDPRSRVGSDPPKRPWTWPNRFRSALPRGSDCLP